MSLPRPRNGRLLLRWWFPAAGTPDCARQAMALRTEAADLAATGLDVVGLSMDTQDDLDSWRAALGLPFTLISATPAMAAEGGALREPGDPYRAYQAARVASIVDGHGTVRAHWQVSDPAHFVDAVREQLRTLGEV